MKRLTQLLTVLSIVCFSVTAQAQAKTGADFFEGKWNVLLKGIPGGDSKIFIVLDRADTTLAGIVQDSTGTQISKIDKVELTENSVTVYFSAQGYDVNLVMNKKDDDHVTGTLMNMFEAEGERVKVIK